MSQSASKILLIDNYDSFTFNLYQLLQQLVWENNSESRVMVYRNDALTLQDIQTLNPTHIVLSPGPGHPAKASDFGICQQVIEEFDTLQAALLGVCLGHQGIAHYLGGEVVKAPNIVHGKTSRISYTADSKLFQGLPNPFTAMRYHSWVVSPDTFPSCLRITASEPAQNLIMGLEHTTKPIFGVQFHPESIGTPEGALIARNFLTQQR